MPTTNQINAAAAMVREARDSGQDPIEIFTKLYEVLDIAPDDAESGEAFASASGFGIARNVRLVQCTCGNPEYL